ncbi:MAG: hypothetical protein HY923_03780 [Elusimicrobia bacterium]|nr:hypothetical protein [Elusimicrobiota bacterium]
MRTVVFAALLAVPASAETAAVLSSQSKPYREALEGLREALGPDAPPALAGLDNDAAAETVVAFGAKAAQIKYKNASTLIVAMAPGYMLSGHEAVCTVVVSAMPAPARMVAAMRRLQPGLKRIWVPWVSPALGPYLKSFVKAGLASGIAVETDRMEKAEGLPDRLRAADFESAAILLPPDPLLISESTFAMLKQAARTKKIPLYAPFANLVAEGATASLGSTFHEMGRVAGSVVGLAKEKERCGTTVYPERLSIRVSLSGSAAAGLSGDPAFYDGFAETTP